MDTQPEKLPLFKERARTTHPVTSKIRAAKLDGSVKLSKRVMAVLKIVRDNPGKNARELGHIMYLYSGNIDSVTYPHKCLSKLVDAGYVTREYAEHGELCETTEAGIKFLQNLK